MSDMTGRLLGPYTIVSELGHGGMANVYLGRQPSVEREVAIKVLPAHFLQDRTFLDRFTREAKIVARLQHPCILPVYDFGEQDGMPFIVMAYMSGGTLADVIRDTPGGLPLDKVTKLVDQIASALDYAHKHGIIHRDFKPSNVLLDRDGNPYLADFGLARAVEDGAHLTGSGILGTPSYMAPEMSRPGDPTPLVDIYALGVTLYEMLTGQRPYQAATPVGVLLAHTVQPIPDACALRPDLPEAAQDVIVRAMAKEPAERYQSAEELAEAFRGAIGSPTTPARGTRRPQALRQPNAPTIMGTTERLLPGVLSATRRVRRAISPVVWVGLGILGVGLLAGAAALGGLFTSRPQSPAGTGQPPTAAANLAAGPTPTAAPTGAARFVPNGAVARLGKGTVRQIAFSTGGVTPATPDKYLLAVASSTGLYVYRGDTFEQLWFRPLNGGAYGVAAEGLSDRLAAAAGSGVRHWGVSTGDSRDLWAGDPAYRLAVSPDGATLATVADDGRTITLWAGGDVKLFTLTGHTDEIQSLAFSPDGNTLASASYDKTVILWNVVTGQQIRTFTDHADMVSSAIFSPDGATMISGAYNNTIFFWNASTGKVLKSLKADIPVTALALSPDGKILASGMDNGPVILWDAASGQQLHTLTGHRNIVNSMVFSPDGKTLFSAAIDGSVFAWDTGSGKQLKALTGFTPNLLSVAFSPDGKRLASATNAGTVILWDTATNQPLQTLFSSETNGGFYLPTENAIFAPDGATLASITNGSVDLWDIAAGKVRLALPQIGAEAIAYSTKDGQLAVATNLGKVLLFDGTSDQPRNSFDIQTAPVKALTFSPDGSMIATGSEDKTVMVLDAATGKALQTLSGHSGLVHSVTFSPDGKTLAAGADDGTIVLWDVTTGKQIRVLTDPSHDVSSVAFSPDGTLLASAIGDVIIWNVSSGQQVKTLPGRTAYGVAFSPDGKTLAASSQDGTIILWDMTK